MTSDPLTVTPEARIAGMWDAMRELEVRHVPVGRGADAWRPSPAVSMEVSRTAAWSRDFGVAVDVVVERARGEALRAVTRVEVGPPRLAAAGS